MNFFFSKLPSIGSLKNILPLYELNSECVTFSVNIEIHSKKYSSRDGSRDDVNCIGSQEKC